jgi:hypothetical protein
MAEENADCMYFSFVRLLSIAAASSAQTEICLSFHFSQTAFDGMRIHPKY